MVYRQTPRSEKVRATARARIMNAAKALFAERGYDRTTMADIVREAGTSIGNAYFYFSNKEDLLTSLMEEGVHATWARADEVIANVEPGPARVAVAVHSNTVGFLTTNKDLTRIAVTAGPEAVRHILDLHGARLLALLLANFPDRSEKELRMTVVAIGGANRTAIEWFLTDRLDVPPLELANFLIRWHLRALELSEPEVERIARIAERAVGSSADEGSRRRSKANRAAKTAT